MIDRAGRSARALLACAAVLGCSAGHATNGLNLIGFGAESSLMGGADVAVARDTAALNTNPAGLARLRAAALDVYGASSYALDTGHTDARNDNLEVDRKVINVGGLGFARPLGGSGLVLGAGAFVQGGAGAVFENMNTPFGTVDELSSRFGAAKLTAGLAWRPAETWMLGVAPSVFLGRLEQKLFPATSAASPGGTFFGSTLDGAQGSGFGLKVGALYQPAPALTVGAAYTSRTRLDLENGRLTLNMAAIGLGEVAYRDARVQGLAFPQQAALGFAWQASGRLLWSVKVEWLDWSRAVREVTLSASGPDNPAAPATVSQTQTLGWRDQYVLATGIAYASTARTTLRAGINYARSPAPPEHSSPILNPIGETHLTFGASRKLGTGHELHAGLEYQLPNRVSYHNRAQPFGRAEWREESLALHAMLAARW